MRMGLQVNQFIPAGGTAAIGPWLAATARRAEEAGFASFWVMDHFFQIPPIGPAEQPMLEGYSALAYAAAVTERISLGTMVTGVTYRHPGILVKTVNTLDVLSGGRAFLGIGAGWFEREHVGLGVPFPPVAERFERLEETLRIAHQMWSGDVGPFTGKHFQLAETLGNPMPISQPHPPVLIGGGGERKTLRLVARYADACNLFAFDLEQVRHKLDVLWEHCEPEGRPYDAIEKTTIALPRISRGGGEGTITPDAAIERLSQLAELGIEQHLVGMPTDQESFELLATEIVPRAVKIAVAGQVVAAGAPASSVGRA